MSHLRKKIKSELEEIRDVLDRVLGYPTIKRAMEGKQQHKVALCELTLVESRIAGIKKLIKLELEDFDSS